MIKPDRQDDLSGLAGEYVLGTLSGEQRDEFERELLDNEQLQSEVAAWEQNFAPMLDSVDPVTPPPRVWKKIEQRITPKERGSETKVWDSLSFWRNLGMVTTSLLLGISLTLLVTWPGSQEMDRMMVVLNPQSQAGWLVGTQSGSEGFVLAKAIQPPTMEEGKVCQLWMEDSLGRLMPLGILPHDGQLRMKMPAKLGQNNRFKVSIESLSQMPKQQPSSEIVFEGALTEI